MLAFIAIFDDESCMSYPGGKGRLYQNLINLMPPHEVYIEAFLGEGAVMRRKLPAVRNIGIDLDKRILSEWANRRHQICETIHADALDFLRDFDFSGRELVYCDPPYLPHTRKSSRRLYRFEFDATDHDALIQVLNGLQCTVMLSGRQCELYADRLKQWHRIDLENVTRNGKMPESVWLNYPPPVVLHDYRFLGSSFRERQRIQRKLTRLSARLRSLPTIERNALRSHVWSGVEKMGEKL